MSCSSAWPRRGGTARRCREGVHAGCDAAAGQRRGRLRRCAAVAPIGPPRAASKDSKPFTARWSRNCRSRRCLRSSRSRVRDCCGSRPGWRPSGRRRAMYQGSMPWRADPVPGARGFRPRRDARPARRAATRRRCRATRGRPDRTTRGALARRARTRQGAVTAAPDAAEPRRLLALALGADDRADEAIEQCSRRPARSDRRARATGAGTNAGVCRSSRDGGTNLPGTLAAIPMSAHSHFELGRLYDTAGRHREAADAFAAAAAVRRSSARSACTN